MLHLKGVSDFALHLGKENSVIPSIISREEKIILCKLLDIIGLPYCVTVAKNETVIRTVRKEPRRFIYPRTTMDLRSHESVVWCGTSKIW